MVSPVFKTAWAAVRSPEGSTPFLLRQCNEISAVWVDAYRSRRPAEVLEVLDAGRSWHRAAGANAGVATAQTNGVKRSAFAVVATTRHSHRPILRLSPLPPHRCVSRRCQRPRVDVPASKTAVPIDVASGGRPRTACALLS